MMFGIPDICGEILHFAVVRKTTYLEGENIRPPNDPSNRRSISR